MRTVLAWLASRLLLLLSLSLRTRRIGWRRVEELQARGEPYSFALLHGRALLMLAEMRDERCAALVSQSRDGDLASRLLTNLGYGVVRGSSSQDGAAGLRGLCRAQRSGLVPTLTVDGPRGPLGSVAPGITGLAKITQSWIVPVSASCSGGFRLTTWDRSLLPRPGARTLLVFGRPMRVERAENSATATEDLAKRLQNLGKQADRLSGVAW